MKWCLKIVKQMEIPYGFIILAKCRPLKCTFKLQFQIWTLHGIKLIFGHIFLSFFRDIHFEDDEDLSQDVSFFVQYIIEI